MNSITAWDYNASVERVRPMVIKWRTLTVELVGELYQAREALRNIGGDRRSESFSVPNGTLKSWADYLNDVGLAKSTVHRWLERYIPEENKLLTPEELEERKAIETRAKQDEATAIAKRVKEAKNKGARPADWDEKTEREYQRQLREDEERKQRVNEAAEREREYKEEQRRKEDERKAKLAGFESFQENMDDILSDVKSDFDKRKSFKEKIKLSQSGESDLFIDALMDYLDDLEDDNRRIEACQNIIKVCKNIAAELQMG